MTRTLTKREKATLDANDERVTAVPCPRCGAAAGQPCVSFAGNVTWPHVGRRQEAGAL